MQFGEKTERMFMKSTMIFPSKSIHREPGKRSEIVHSCLRTLQEKDFLLLLSLASIKNLLFNGRTRSCYKTYPAIYCNFLVSPWSLIIFHFLGKELKGKGMLRFNELELSVVCVESRGRGQAGMGRAEG